MEQRALDSKILCDWLAKDDKEPLRVEGIV